MSKELCVPVVFPEIDEMVFLLVLMDSKLPRNAINLVLRATVWSWEYKHWRSMQLLK